MRWSHSYYLLIIKLLEVSPQLFGRFHEYEIRIQVDDGIIDIEEKDWGKYPFCHTWFWSKFFESI